MMKCCLWNAAGSSRRQDSSPADSVLIECETNERCSARASLGVIPQAKIKTVKMTFAIVLSILPTNFELLKLKQEAQLSRRDHVMLCAIKYIAK